MATITHEAKHSWFKDVATIEIDDPDRPPQFVFSYSYGETIEIGNGPIKARDPNQNLWLNPTVRFENYGHDSSCSKVYEADVTLSNHD